MAEMAMLATAVMAAVDAGLSGALLALYARSFTQLRAPFTIGLVVFAALFLLQNLLALYAYATMMDYVPAALAPYMLGIMVVEGIALGAMLYSALQ